MDKLNWANLEVLQKDSAQLERLIDKLVAFGESTTSIVFLRM